jgi:hypothetical protein|tara:strand:+ start:34 stop:870 length:837 start_codon:yes stop_codon:yes gene_type:complete
MAIGIPGGQVQVTAGTGPVATGQQYAQQIAGGIPFEQVVAPGLSFSPDMPMGYTQAQLDMMSGGQVPVMPTAPTIGIPVQPSEPMMPYAPTGTPQPEVLVPKEEYKGFFPFLQSLTLPQDVAVEDLVFDTTFAPELYTGDVAVPKKFDLDVEAILSGVDPEELAKIDVDKLDLPDMPTDTPIYEPRDPFIVKDFFEPQQPLEPVSLLEPQPTQAPVMPSAPSLLQQPVIPVTQPVTTPVIPTSLTGLPQFQLPQIEEIVSPIQRGRVQPSLFGFGPTP